MLERRLAAWQIFESLADAVQAGRSSGVVPISASSSLTSLTPYTEADGAAVDRRFNLSGTKAGVITQQNSVTVDRSAAGRPDAARE